MAEAQALLAVQVGEVTSSQALQGHAHLNPEGCPSPQRKWRNRRGATVQPAPQYPRQRGLARPGVSFFMEKH